MSRRLPLKSAFCTLLCLVMAQPCLLAQAVEPETILIRNVLLIDRDGKVEDAVVNILIKDRKLAVVTKDKIAAAGADLVVDAQGGVLLGKLPLREPPSFLILDQDPRENFEVLLDTETHARFAVHEGVIIKNTLPAMTDGKEEAKKPGWIAYTPPPMSLPVSYQDNTKWNKWESKSISGIFLAGLVLDRQNYIRQDDVSEQQVGDLGEFDGGEIRGVRFGAIGTLNFKKPWIYSIFAVTTAFDKGFDSDQDDDLQIFDYRVDVPIPGGMTLSVGRQKEPISMEKMMSLVFEPMQERSSVSDALLPARNVGVMLSGTALKQRMTWAGGVFNDSIDSGDSLSEGSSQLIGRLTWLPFVSGDESNLLHLGFGARHSNAKEGIRAATGPEFNNAPLFVDTDFFEADDLLLHDLEISWRKGPLWIAGEYLWVDVDAPASGDPSFSGYHVTGSWALSGEMRPYNKKSGLFGSLPVSRAVNQGGWGAWEVALRWSDLDLSDGTVDGGEMETLSLGVNWWPRPTASMSVNYRAISLDRFGDKGVTHGFNIRAVFLLE